MVSASRSVPELGSSERGPLVDFSKEFPERLNEALKRRVSNDQVMSFQPCADGESPKGAAKSHQKDRPQILVGCFVASILVLQKSTRSNGRIWLSLFLAHSASCAEIHLNTN